MSFISVRFLLFLVAVILVYYVLPRRYQWWVFIPANMWFYTVAGWRAIPFLLITVISTYICGRLLGSTQRKYKEEKKRIAAIEKEDFKKQRKQLKSIYDFRKKRLMWVILSLNFGIWFFCKQTVHTERVFVPFAISYYTFIAVGYCIDVYSGKYECEKSIFRYFAFLSFFPQMVEGPFSRYDTLANTLFAEHEFSFERFEKGLLRMIWGYCKKMVLSNIIWTMISAVYMADGVFSGKQTIMLIILLPLQQYADFSGCMDIALGMSQILGIELQENFRQPIFAKSVDEIWRRWHLTLCAWFRDYLFYPVALNKSINRMANGVGKKNKYLGQIFPSSIALFAVWTITGLWHGTAWKFLLWGWMNFFFLEMNMLFKEKYSAIRIWLHIDNGNFGWKLFCIVRTYFIFGIMELVADGPSAGHDIRMLLALFRPAAWMNQVDILPGGTVKAAVIIITGAVLLFVIDMLKEKDINIADKVISLPVLPKTLVFVSVIYIIVLLTPVGVNISEGFAYAQF